MSVMEMIKALDFLGIWVPGEAGRIGTASKIETAKLTSPPVSRSWY